MVNRKLVRPNLAQLKNRLGDQAPAQENGQRGHAPSGSRESRRRPAPGTMSQSLPTSTATASETLGTIGQLALYRRSPLRAMVSSMCNSSLTSGLMPCCVVDDGLEELFAAAGLAPEDYQGRRLRVRGWLKSLNGPMIVATHPEQLEILEEQRGSPAPGRGARVLRELGDGPIYLCGEEERGQ